MIFGLGYFARIAPEKGLHRLVDAFIRLASQSSHDDVTLHVAGWLGEANQPYLQEQQRKIADAALSHRFTYHGSPNLEEKIGFLRTLDLLCVPTDYEEPKGLFVLESLAAGVPVVQPNHGAFAELIEATGGGLVVQPDCVDAICDAIERLKDDPQRREALGRRGASTASSRNIRIERPQQLACARSSRFDERLTDRCRARMPSRRSVSSRMIDLAGDELVGDKAVVVQWHFDRVRSLLRCHGRSSTE